MERDTRPRVSIIIPAWNEELLLGKTLDHLKSVVGTIPLAEIIVVDNNSSDATAEIGRKHGAQVVFEEHNQIARARNTGASTATGQLLFFIDADTWPSAEILQKGYELLQEGAVGVGTVITFDSSLNWFWSCSLGMWNWVSRQFKVAAGSFLLCNAQAFKDVGGFPLDMYAGEEIMLSRRLKAWGKKHKSPFKILTTFDISTSARKFTGGMAFASFLQIIVVTMCPWLVRRRWACWMWYRR